MKTMFKVLSLAAVLSVAAPLALASSITIESYGTNLNGGPTPPSDIGNTALMFNAAGSADFNPNTSTSETFDIPTVLPWANLDALSGTSSWVSYNPGTYVGGNYTAPSGNYIYHTTFQGAVGDTGSITVLADDTTSIVLNGHQITPQAVGQANNCTIGTPNCVQEATYTIDTSFFVAGTNQLKFVVAQDFGSATGLDFVGTINSSINSNASTPEPSSLLLLGTGLLSVVGAARRKFKA